MPRPSLLSFLVLLTWQFIAPALAADAAAVTLEQRWSYRWSDLPTASATADWQPARTPDSLPDRNGRNVLWLKLDLPRGDWRDPHLFISSADLTLQVFDGSGRRLYTFGESDRFAGWPWHLIKLPHAALGQPIYLRIFSNYHDIGLAGDVALGERADLLQQRVYSRGFAGVIAAAVVFFVGLISMCLGFVKRDRPKALATGLLSFDLALMMFAENELSQLVAFSPLLWRQLAAGAYFLVPGLLASVVLAWFRPSPPRSAYVVIAVSLAFAVGVLGRSLAGGFNFIDAYPTFDVLFIGLMLALLVDGARHLRPLNLEGGLMVAGIFTVLVSLLIDMASAYSVIPWLGHAGQWGLAMFALSSLGMYLVRVWRQQQELQRLRRSLQLQVDERTRDLVQSQQQLLKLAHEDDLTGLLNRRAFMTQAVEAVAHAMRHGEPLALALFDVDHFKIFNDQHGHAVGDKVLRAIAGVVRKHGRNGDLLCRYGGEEFVMLMPRTAANIAQTVIERLHRSVADLAVHGRPARSLSVSVSIGVVVMNESARQLQNPERMLDQILSQADAAMYEIKNAGRNGVNLTHGLWSADTGAWTARRQAVR